MKQSLFILLLGFAAGVLYTQHEGFKSGIDDSIDSVKNYFIELWEDCFLAWCCFLSLWY